MLVEFSRSAVAVDCTLRLRRGFFGFLVIVSNEVFCHDPEVSPNGSSIADDVQAVHRIN